MTSSGAIRSRLPYWVLLGIVLALAWGLVASGLAQEILRYRKDIVYLTRQHLLLVAISGYALPDDVARSVAAGFDRHLAKPVTLEQLAEVLAAARRT